MRTELPRSDEHDRDNILDRLTPRSRLAYFEERLVARQRHVLERKGLFDPPPDGRRLRVLSVGCGTRPRRGLPEGDYFIAGIDSEPTSVKAALDTGEVDDVRLGAADDLPFDDGEFDVVVFRLVLHHVVHQGPLGPTLRDAARVLRPGGTIIAVEPGLFHPIGALLAAANALGVSKKIKGTRDDCPLSPLHLTRILRRFGFRSELSALEYSWRRLPVSVQYVLSFAEGLGCLPLLKLVAHTFLLIARRS